MIGLAVLVASIGLVDSINPSTLAPALVLASGQHAVPRLASFIGGVFLVTFAAGFLIVLGPGELLLDALPHFSAHAKHIGEVVGGVILGAVAVVVWVKRRHVQERVSGVGTARGRRSSFALGAGIMALELPTAAPYFAAIAAILGARLSFHSEVIMLVIFNVAFVAPLLAMLALRVYAGPRAQALLTRMDSTMRTRAATLLACLLGVLAAALLAVGIAGLI